MRIISLSPSVTEILFAIGAGKNIIANTAYCDYPEKARDIEKIGSWIHIDDKKIEALKPDLIVSSTIVQKNANTRYKNFKHLHLDPRSLSDIFKNIALLGEITNRQKQARKLVDKMKNTNHSTLNNLRNRSKQAKYLHKPRIYVEEWFDPPMISGNWVPEMVRVAGGKYFPGIKKRGISRAVTDKEMIKFNPVIIFVSYCGFKDKSDPKKILARPGWEEIEAIRNKNIFVLNDDLINRPGPRIIEGIKQIRKFVH